MRSHRILASLRTTAAATATHSQRAQKDHLPQKYHLPRGWLFDYIATPHYLFEIGVYISLWMIAGWRSSSLLLVLAFVCLNLGHAARETLLWSRRTFKEYPPNRKALVPFVW
eukprot:TRINITY_DN852_c0_g1_i4.p1 TRINITY_DN852_c0_g1~~TRINITY_DN852_c0_g1_i4.p1  ORF type:complete len:112 (+),score=23.35 TRINITY_DN852_c0_g1_i4:1897-2232(+)